MPMPNYDPEEPPMIGFCMVGAYQEILGNMHNFLAIQQRLTSYIDNSVEVRYLQSYAPLCQA
ncbi:Biosynthetic arginine decarboxylase [Arsenophonus endosymbiont of Bemisia tabaci Q2]|nr:Biosynthetic arginine decarboxylase [Arsenophonus endosymbiont of Bemisia tabaci Q2]